MFAYQWLTQAPASWSRGRVRRFGKLRNEEIRSFHQVERSRSQITSPAVRLRQPQSGPEFPVKWIIRVADSAIWAGRRSIFSLFEADRVQEMGRAAEGSYFPDAMIRAGSSRRVCMQNRSVHFMHARRRRGGTSSARDRAWAVLLGYGDQRRNYARLASSDRSIAYLRSNHAAAFRRGSRPAMRC